MNRRLVGPLLLVLGLGGAGAFLALLPRQPDLSPTLAEFLRACDAPDASVTDLHVKTALQRLSGWELGDLDTANRYRRTMLGTFVEVLPGASVEQVPGTNPQRTRLKARLRFTKGEAPVTADFIRPGGLWVLADLDVTSPPPPAERFDPARAEARAIESAEAFGSALQQRVYEWLARAWRARESLEDFEQRMLPLREGLGLVVRSEVLTRSADGPTATFTVRVTFEKGTRDVDTALVLVDGLWWLSRFEPHP